MSRVPQRPPWSTPRQALSSQQLDRLYTAVMVALGLWLAVWLLLPWDSLHDTALTYLRVATDLDANRSIWAGGSDWGTGRLSLLYVPLLMLVHSLFNYAVALRVVSTIGYVVLIARLALGLSERVRRAGPLTLLLSVLAVAVLCTPAAVFWLNDGTETSFGLLIVLMIVMRTRRVMRHGTSSSWPLAFWCVAAVLLRVEMFYGAMAVCIMLSLWATDEVGGKPARSRRSAVATPWQTPLIAGVCALAALIILRLVLQIGLPLHATLWPVSWGWAAVSAWLSLLEARSFGWGLLALWIVSAALLYRIPHRVKVARVANLLPIFVLLTLILRGEQISFAAELAWPILFAILWNILEISTAERDQTVAAPLVVQGAIAAFSLVLLLGVSLPWEGPLVLRAMHSRRDQLRLMQEHPLGLLVGLHGIADDPGAVGYFTLAPICNPGRPMGARMAPDDYPERLHACVAARPDFAFLDQRQVNDLALQMDLSAWSICQSFDVQGLSTHDQHFLVASPNATERVCLASHGLAVPLASMLPPPEHATDVDSIQ
ncbi:hypothetical protein SAMN05421819_3027 [Bryocella elongata]|uniref:Dolichyl-phosphate-mannose-protein mannosyltransferase n=1 Tax=Bryocella elongata TaxID=863522 RepID=A0A1H6AB72_9BACT|nr:hypothetical protein [Bryocella elongata]SEG45622.1 hypothetical protein SAMN05421819_3027 [Bryocella elongata]